MAIKYPVYETRPLAGGGTSSTVVEWREVPAEDEVRIAPEPIVYERDFDGELSWTVDFDYSAVGVDRAVTHGIETGPGTRGKKLADRLAAATRAGVVEYDQFIRRDVNGRSYVASTSRVMGKYLNADLKRLGF